MFNLIQNAVKYNLPGGKVVVTLRIIENEQKITNLYVEVIDTGMGIDAHRHHLLFAPFLELRNKQSLSEVKDNSIGLGLTCSRDIVNALGGKIQLKLSNDRVTVFAFSIPIQNPDDVSDNVIIIEDLDIEEDIHSLIGGS